MVKDRVAHLDRLSSDNRNTVALYAKLSMELADDMKASGCDAKTRKKFHPVNQVPWLMKSGFIFEGFAMLYYVLTYGRKKPQELPNSTKEYDWKKKTFRGTSTWYGQVKEVHDEIKEANPKWKETLESLWTDVTVNFDVSW